MARPRQISDEAIREAARAVFVEEGPSAPVSRVAQRLGVSSAALFARVGSKERLMLLALEPERPKALEAFGAGPPLLGWEARLIAILLELMTFYHHLVPNLVMLRASGVIPDAPNASGEAPAPVLLRRALAEWLSAPGPDAGAASAALAEGLLGAMEARCFNHFLGGRAFAPGEDSAFVRELVLGLVGRREEGDHA